MNTTKLHVWYGNANAVIDVVDDGDEQYVSDQAEHYAAHHLQPKRTMFDRRLFGFTVISEE